MRHQIGTALEILALTLFPGLALGCFLLLLYDALPTLQVAIESLVANATWAQIYLAAIVVLLISAPGVTRVESAVRRPRTRAAATSSGGRTEDRL
jgi:hypothetical protein